MRRCHAARRHEASDAPFGLVCVFWWGLLSKRIGGIRGSIMTDLVYNRDLAERKIEKLTWKKEKTKKGQIIMVFRLV